jgi:hypothetical protein
LDLVKGHCKRLISYSPTLVFSLLHDLGGFSLDLDLDGGERKHDLELLGCFFLILLYLYDFLAACARSRSWTGKGGCTRHQG